MEFERFIELIRASLGPELPADATPDLRLHEDLGLDSFSLLEVMTVLEEMKGSLAPVPGEAPELRTLGDAFAYYQRL